MDTLKQELCMMLVVAICVAILTALTTDICVAGSFQSDAVKKGYAHWEPNPADGSPHFTWNK